MFISLTKYFNPLIFSVCLFYDFLLSLTLPFSLTHSLTTSLSLCVCLPLSHTRTNKHMDSTTVAGKKGSI